MDGSSKRAREETWRVNRRKDPASTFYIDRPRGLVEVSFLVRGDGHTLSSDLLEPFALEIVKNARARNRRRPGPFSEIVMYSVDLDVFLLPSSWLDWPRHCRAFRAFLTGCCILVSLVLTTISLVVLSRPTNSVTYRKTRSFRQNRSRHSCNPLILPDQRQPFRRC